MTDKKKFIPKVKEKTEKVKIKPRVPNGSVNNHKFTFEIRVLIHKLSTELPPVPFFIMNNGKAVIQLCTKVKYLKTEHSKEHEGKLVNHFQKGKETRMMNHKVNLNSQYQRYGEQGINDYVAYVKDLNAQLAAMQQRVDAAVEAKKEEMEPVVKILKKPELSEFGYRRDLPSETGAWEVEGGEQAYNSAMADYEEQQRSLHGIAEESPKELSDDNTEN